MRHKWINPHQLEYHHNDGKSECQICGLIRLRSNDRTIPQVYYYYNKPESLSYKAPKCKAL
jgi:hypothetical protein